MRWLMRKVLYILSRLSDEDVDWMAQAGKRTRHAPGDDRYGAPARGVRRVGSDRPKRV